MLNIKRLAVCIAACGFLAGQASAEVAKLTVDFGFFPRGTTCEVFNTTGRVSLKAGREIEYSIKGDTAGVSFRCQQPDGRRFGVEIAPLLPAGDHDLVAVQVNQDDHAHVLWDDGGLQRMTKPGILKWE